MHGHMHIKFKEILILKNLNMHSTHQPQLKEKTDWQNQPEKKIPLCLEVYLYKPV